MTDETLTGQASSSTEHPVSLRQAFVALGFVAIYIAAGAVAVVVAGRLGLFDDADTWGLSAVVLFLTALPFMAIRRHLLHRNQLSWADVGFRRPSWRLLHVFWQIPAVIITAALVQIICLAPFGGSNGGGDGSLADLNEYGGLAVLGIILAVGLLTPIWEEVLFRGALLSGLSSRFGGRRGVLLSAALFAVVHLAFPVMPFLFLFGVGAALMMRFHRNLWASVLLHATNNTLLASSILLSG